MYCDAMEHFQTTACKFCRAKQRKIELPTHEDAVKQQKAAEHSRLLTTVWRRNQTHTHR